VCERYFERNAPNLGTPKDSTRQDRTCTYEPALRSCLVEVEALHYRSRASAHDASGPARHCGWYCHAHHAASMREYRARSRVKRIRVYIGETWISRTTHPRPSLRRGKRGSISPASMPSGPHAINQIRADLAFPRRQSSNSACASGPTFSMQLLQVFLFVSRPALGPTSS